MHCIYIHVYISQLKLIQPQSKLIRPWSKLIRLRHKWKWSRYKIIWPWSKIVLLRSNRIWPWTKWNWPQSNCEIMDPIMWHRFPILCYIYVHIYIFIIIRNNWKLLLILLLGILYTIFCLHTWSLVKVLPISLFFTVSEFIEVYPITWTPQEMAVLCNVMGSFMLTGNGLALQCYGFLYVD